MTSTTSTTSTSLTSLQALVNRVLPKEYSITYTGNTYRISRADKLSCLIYSNNHNNIIHFLNLLPYVCNKEVVTEEQLEEIKKCYSMAQSLYTYNYPLTEAPTPRVINDKYISEYNLSNLDKATICNCARFSIKAVEKNVDTDSEGISYNSITYAEADVDMWENL